jgi:hypothetical protein
MKLSEAILLGSTVLTAKAGGQHFSENQAGCALGMAAVARGCRFGPASGPFDERDRRTLGAEGVWGDWVAHTVVRPCRCWRFSIPREMRIKDVIAHLFDHHVMTKKNWTLEQLVAWVETVEPKEVEPPPTRADMINALLARQNPEELRRKLTAQRLQKQEEEEWHAVTRAFAAKHESTHSSRSRRTKV